VRRVFTPYNDLPNGNGHDPIVGNASWTDVVVKKSTALALAFAFAPLPVPFVIAAVVLAVPGVPLTRVHAQTLTVRLYEAVGHGLAALLIAYAVTCCLWVTVHFGFVRPPRRSRLLTCVLVGGVVGGIVPLLAASTILVWQMSATDLHPVAVLYLTVMGAVAGAASGAVFQKVLRATSNRGDEMSG
jgi:hypothetical protein